MKSLPGSKICATNVVVIRMVSDLPPVVQVIFRQQQATRLVLIPILHSTLMVLTITPLVISDIWGWDNFRLIMILQNFKQGQTVQINGCKEDLLIKQEHLKLHL